MFGGVYFGQIAFGSSPFTGTSVAPPAEPVQSAPGGGAYRYADAGKKLQDERAKDADARLQAGIVLDDAEMAEILTVFSTLPD